MHAGAAPQGTHAPTIREIGQGLGLSSPGTVSMHLKHLEQDKLIERYANHARAIRVRGIL